MCFCVTDVEEAFSGKNEEKWKSVMDEEFDALLNEKWETFL